MKKQTIDIKCNNKTNKVTIAFKDSKTITLTVLENEIELKKIYDCLKLVKGEQLAIKKSCKKYEVAETDIQRLYNNVFEFIEEIIKEVNKANK